MRYRLFLALVAVLAVVVTAIARAPAVWVADALQSHGRLRLVDVRGTVWNASAMVGVSDGRQVLLIPGRVSWKIGLAAITSGRVMAEIAHPSLPALRSASSLHASA